MSKIFIYRITHIDNIPHILEYGITHKLSNRRNENYKAIGDRTLIENRNRKIVKYILPDGIEASINLGDYIPFYFGVRMPMLFVIQKGGNFVEEATMPEDIVYLVCDLSKISESGIDFCFSDGHAYDRFTTFYNCSSFSEIMKVLDWESISSKYWSGEDNLDKKRKMQAEALILGDIPFDFIEGFLCYNGEAKARLISLGIKDEIIQVKPNAYY